MTAIPLYLDVVARLPGDYFAWVVHAFLEEDPALTQVVLAEQLGVAPGTVQRAVKRLRDAELLGEARASARLPRASDRAPARGRRASVIGSSRAGERSSSNELFPTGTAPKGAGSSSDAVRVCQRVWTEKDPKPVMNFGRAVKLAQRFLDAGWHEDYLVRGMVEAPTISDGWVESWLRRNQPRLPIEQDRDAPTGRVKL